MSENHPDGYRKIRRAPIGKRDPRERVRDTDEVWLPVWNEGHLRSQGQRCMDCGVPTCMAGCPLGNIIPDWNDLVYRAEWREAIARLHATNNFPEFTGYTCPAPCEDSCTLAFTEDAVTIKSIERAISDRAWDEGWIQPRPPESRTGFHVAVVGSGPAGLAAAQQLNRAGHRVTVFEADDFPGGLMTYGIPDFKFARRRVKRRIDQLTAEGIEFRTGCRVGKDVPAQILLDDFDAACLALGAQEPIDLNLPGRELDGVHFAMEFLTRANRLQNGQAVESPISAEGKNVVVLGGGDTGADCVATSLRQGAKQVVQIELLPKPPEERGFANPWPEHPQVYSKSYAQEEGGVEQFALATKAFLDEDGDGRVDRIRADRLEWILDHHGHRTGSEVAETDLSIPADLALLAIGFHGPRAQVFEDLGVALGERGRIQVGDDMMTSVDGIFAAGDARMGPSLVVWAIAEGRDVARSIDRYLTGEESELPRSARSENAPYMLRSGL
ncbi:MAG: glutamate synthase subunit beta [Gemmatimonadota bacterium]